MLPPRPPSMRECYAQTRILRPGPFCRNSKIDALLIPRSPLCPPSHALTALNTKPRDAEPVSKKDKCNATEWLKVVLESCNGEFIEGDGLNAKGRIVGDGATRFPLKDKDTCQVLPSSAPPAYSPASALHPHSR